MLQNKQIRKKMVGGLIISSNKIVVKNKKGPSYAIAKLEPFFVLIFSRV